MTGSFAWPPAVCRIVADGGDIRKISCRWGSGKLHWSYRGKYVCSAKARVIHNAPIYREVKA